MSGEDLLIFKKEPFELGNGLCYYNSDIYVLGKGTDNQECVGLRFTGGILTGSIKAFEDCIDRFVKFRNTTTHGNYMKVTGELADTAANLMNLIYISRLDRIGVPRNGIKDRICAGVVYR